MNIETAAPVIRAEPPSDALVQLFLPGFIDALPAAIYTTDASGRITYFNSAAADLWGVSPELGKSEWCGSWRLYRPDGTFLPHDQCPMATALKEQRAIRGAEAIAERPDGTRVPFLAYPTPLFDQAGRLAGAVNMLVDISERKRSEEASRLLALVVESSGDAIISKDLTGRIVSWNKSAERLFGYTADEIIGKPIKTLIPTHLHDEETIILDRIKRGERVEHYETIRQNKDGGSIEISLTVSPVVNAEGRIVGASKIARDITERRRAQEQQRLLFKEMGHRIKNLFAVTSGVVALTARNSQTPEDMAEAVRGRLGALARAHDMARPIMIDENANGEHDTTVGALYHTILAPYDDPTRPERIRFEGTDAPIGGSAVTGLALVLHELATNAAKYGAFSSDDGVVHLVSLIEEDMLRLTWTEQGGPPVREQPLGEGFGSKLARRTVETQFGGTISHDWAPGGLIVGLSLATSKLSH